MDVEGDLPSHKRAHVSGLACALWRLRRFEPLGEPKIAAAAALVEAAPPLPETVRNPRTTSAEGREEECNNCGEVFASTGNLDDEGVCVHGTGCNTGILMGDLN